MSTHALIYHLGSAGLNAGDEILQLNGKDSCRLKFGDMKGAFSQASLSLTVNTLPSTDRRQICYLPPRRSDAQEVLHTAIFSVNQGELEYSSKKTSSLRTRVRYRLYR